MTSASPLRSASQRALSELVQARDVRLTGTRAVLVGGLIGVSAVFAKAFILRLFDDPGYVVFVAAVMASAWIGGVLGGMVTLGVTTGLHALLLIADPLGWWAPPGSAELFKVVFFVGVGLVTVLLIGSRRAAHDRLADALEHVATLAQEVEARDQRLELVLASSGTGIWEWDMTSGELEWSEAIFRQHGLSPSSDAPSYEAYLATIHPDDQARFRDAIAQVIEQGGQFDVEFRVVWPDGSVHWTRGVGRAFRDGSGRPIRMVGTGTDITERRRLDDQRERLAEEERHARDFREAFVDVISHELRTPITTILGLTQILARPGRTDDPVARAALLDDVRAESERLHRLVEDLLVLSRVEHGRLVVETEPIEPRRLIERIVAWETGEHPSIVIGLEVEPNLPIVAGEATYVEQVMRNLLDNAAKYSPPGSAVTVSARAEDEGVAFRVSDEGSGIDEASTERLFELFYRDPKSARMAAGSGIGLFVCANLVAAMGGRTWAKRRRSGGSEFGFTLRAMEADDDQLIAEPAVPSSAEAQQGPDLGAG